MPISSALGSSALLPAGLGFRNTIINGDFRINQRGFTSTSSSTQYGFDRWSFAYSGGTTTSSAQTFTPGSGPASDIEAQNFWRLAVSGQSAAGDLCFGYQYIEDVRLLAGKQVTVSFYAKASSGTPKVAIEIGQKFGSGGSPSADVNTYVGQVILSTSWTRYSLTVFVPSIAGKTIGTTANTSSTVLYLWLSGGSTYNSRTGSLGIQSNTFDFWGVQVEANYQPTPFEQRPIGVELALCQRYYQRLTGGSMAVGTIDTANNARGFLAPTPVSLRATPTLSEIGTLKVFRPANITTLDVNSFLGITKNDNAVAFSVDCASGFGVSDIHLLLSASTATDALEMSAEL